MAKKSKRPIDYVHYGKRSWWDSTVKTLCGMKLGSGSKHVMFTGIDCPACKAAQKRGEKL